MKDTIIPLVQSLCDNGTLHGALSAPAPARSSAARAADACARHALFVPRVYSASQREIADAFFATNGYLTEKKGAALGLSRRRMGDFVKDSFVSFARVCVRRACVRWDVI